MQEQSRFDPRLRSNDRDTVDSGAARQQAMDLANANPPTALSSASNPKLLNAAPATHAAFSRMKLIEITLELGAVDRGQSTQAKLLQASNLRRRAFEALLHELQPTHRVAFNHQVDVLNSSHFRYSLEITCSTRGESVVDAQSQLLDLKTNLRAALSAGAPGWRFEEMNGTANGKLTKYARSVALIPHGISLRPTSAVGLVAPGTAQPHSVDCLPLASTSSLFLSEPMLLMMVSIKAPCRVVVEFTGKRLGETELLRIRRAATALAETSTRNVLLINSEGAFAPASAAHIRSTSEALQIWMTQPVGVEMDVRLESQDTMPRSLLRLAGTEILGGRSFDIVEQTPLDQAGSPAQLARYLPIGTDIPALLPEPGTARRLGLAVSLPTATTPLYDAGPIFGHAFTPYGRLPISLPGADRNHSTYVIGRSGTGKSTFLAARIEEDIARGHGVVVVDPHGDLYSDLLQRVPKERARDVVLVDFTDFDYCPGLNLLQKAGGNPELERNFIIRAISQILQRLYGQVPESMGPMFHLYMRSAVALAMEDPRGDATLIDVPRVLADDLYREYLLRHCRDPYLKDFWTGIALRVSGDHELKNLAPWIINKFTEFTDNPLVRNIVGQPISTVNFRSSLDQRHIVLVNLSKGHLGELDSQFLGMLLTSQLLAAAMSRADIAPELRIPSHIYIDEFHSFTTLSSVETLLAECRKYGITVTLAHQNLAQINDRAAQSILANTSAFAIFRLGPHDARVLAPHTGPCFQAEDLATLPDHHAVVQLKVSHSPCTPFLLHTEPPKPINAASCANSTELVESSRRLYCTAAKVVRRHLARRRHAHIGNSRPAELGLSAQLMQSLLDRGVGELSDLLAWTPDARRDIAKSASTARDLRVLKLLETLAPECETQP